MFNLIFVDLWYLFWEVKDFKNITKEKKFIKNVVKVGRAGVQATVQELECVHGMLELEPPGSTEHQKVGVQHTQEELEVAVLLQEICSIREERADIRLEIHEYTKIKTFSKKTWVSI